MSVGEAHTDKLKRSFPSYDEIEKASDAFSLMIARNQRSSRTASWQDPELERDFGFSLKRLILYLVFRESDFKQSEPPIASNEFTGQRATRALAYN